MAKEVRWTKEAEEGFAKVVSYLQDKWTDKEVSNFISATFKTISYITENPLLFRASKKHNIREALVTKHNLLIYSIKPKHIDLISFWDTRKNPKKKHNRKK